jgi:hypothetical protein
LTQKRIASQVLKAVVEKVYRSCLPFKPFVGFSGHFSLWQQEGCNSESWRPTADHAFISETEFGRLEAWAPAKNGLMLD